MTIDEQVEEHNLRVYGGSMPAANKEAMRRKLEREQREEERFAVASTGDGYEDYWLNSI